MLNVASPRPDGLFLSICSTYLQPHIQSLSLKLVVQKKDFLGTSGNTLKTEGLLKLSYITHCREVFFCYLLIGKFKFSNVEIEIPIFGRNEIMQTLRHIASMSRHWRSCTTGYTVRDIYVKVLFLLLKVINFPSVNNALVTQWLFTYT